MLKEQASSTSYSKIAGTIDRRENLSRRELIKEYIEPSRPVVLTDAASKWPGMGKITPEFIKEHYGHFKKEIKGVTYTFADLIDRILNSSPENPAPYPFNVNLETYFPELRKEFKPEIVYGKVDRINHPLLPRFMMNGTEVYEFFIGGRGASFPFLHIDELYLHNQLTQLYGSKEFIMFPQEQTPYLYPTHDNPKVSQVNVLNPDYDRFPLFREAKPIRVLVRQGETLLFPTGWWHTTQIHEPSISLGRCHLNGANWWPYVKDESKVWKRRSPVMAMAVLLYGGFLGKVMDVQDAFVKG
jgi:histone arginine demethylase JMJD6